MREDRSPSRKKKLTLESERFPCFFECCYWFKISKKRKVRNSKKKIWNTIFSLFHTCELDSKLRSIFFTYTWTDMKKPCYLAVMLSKFCNYAEKNLTNKNHGMSTDTPWFLLRRSTRNENLSCCKKIRFCRIKFNIQHSLHIFFTNATFRYMCLMSTKSNFFFSLSVQHKRFIYNRIRSTYSVQRKLAFYPEWNCMQICRSDTGEKIDTLSQYTCEW